MSDNTPQSPRSRFSLPGAKRYQVVSYDVCDEPAGDASFRPCGEFDTAEEALACARAIVDRDLSGMARACETATELIDQFNSFGEGAMIFGDPKIEFNPYAYASERATRLVGRWWDSTY